MDEELAIDVDYAIHSQKTQIFIRVPYDYDLHKIFTDEAYAIVDDKLMSALGY